MFLRSSFFCFWLGTSIRVLNIYKFLSLMAFHINMYTMAGCFSILPASELVPGDIVEVTGTCVVSHVDAVFCNYSESRLTLKGYFS